MDPTDPPVAQKMVAEYATLLEKHARADAHPAPAELLPYSKDTLKTAIGTVVTALRMSHQLNDELRSFLQEAYVSLADYIDDELARLMAEFRQATDDLGGDGRRGMAQVNTPAWKTVSEASTLAGTIARSIAEETEELREEFAQLLR